MHDFVSWYDKAFSQLAQYWSWSDRMFSQYHAWLLPGCLVMFALVGLVLLHSELRNGALDRRKWTS